MLWEWMSWWMRSNREMTQMSSCSKCKPSCQRVSKHCGDFCSTPLKTQAAKWEDQDLLQFEGRLETSSAQEAVEQTGLKLAVWNHRACWAWKRKHRKAESSETVYLSFLHGPSYQSIAAPPRWLICFIFLPTPSQGSYPYFTVRRPEWRCWVICPVALEVSVADQGMKLNFPMPQANS